MLICCCFIHKSFSQVPAEGYIIDQQSREPIGYAAVYHPALKTGVIADANGYFRINVRDEQDSLVFSAVGYKQLKQPSQRIILLQPDITTLGTVEVQAHPDLYYFRCIDSCLRVKQVFNGTSRAVYYQTSSIDSQAVEQIEAYYNAALSGYEIRKLEMKAGRLGIRPLHDHFYISFENARAITRLPVREKARYFPMQPLHMTTDQMAKHYTTELLDQYRNASGERLLHLRCLPRNRTGDAFTTEVILNMTRHYIVQIRWKGNTTDQHPFVPFHNDSIKQVEWDLHRTYTLQHDTLFFQHLDFTYTVHYLRKRKLQPDAAFRATTQAVLYAYAPRQPFLLPSFEFEGIQPDEYRKINALGYHEFFWNNHQEYRISERQDFSKFFEDPSVYSTRTVFSKNGPGRGIFEYPYVHWSRNRIRIKSLTGDTVASPRTITTEREQYQLEVKLMAEFDTLNGLRQLRTAVIFDPFFSYWRVDEDSLTQPFVNIFFDLCEVQRRLLQKKFEQRSDPELLTEIQTAYRKWFERFREDFFREVQRGRNISALEKYSGIIEKELVIRNLFLNPGDHLQED